MTEPTFRSAAVARMAGMPVATLRVWEQRYGAVQPLTTGFGHRLYSSDDLQRVMLLRQLTAQGHAIGSIAGLATAALSELQQVGPKVHLPSPSNATRVNSGRVSSAGPVSGALRLAVVGPALALRLQSAELVQRLKPRVRVVAVFDSLAEAALATGLSIKGLLWHAPELPTAGSADLLKAQRQLGVRHAAVVYRFAESSATRALASQGALILREPVTHDALADWLLGLSSQWRAKLPSTPASHPGAPAQRGSRGGSRSAAREQPIRSLTLAPPRRFDDATLTALAGLSPTLACECPQHIAELLMQLSSFEAYSAACANRSPTDEQLHAYLQQVAGHARSLFEAALERVAAAEGLALG